MRTSFTQARALTPCTTRPRKPSRSATFVAVDANVFFARPDIERQEILHAGRLGEKIGCMPELWCLHHHSADIEDVFISEQIEPPRPLRQLLMKETVVLWP